jgi:predicted transposase YdaD
VGTVSDISGASFAFAIVTLSIGRVTMFATRIFRDKWKDEGREEGRQEGRQEGREEMKALVLRAISERREGETAEQAIERVIAESWGKAS